MKNLGLLIFVRLILIAIFINCCWLFNVSAEDLNQIYDYVREELNNYDRFPEQGWWQIENTIKNKYDIIIPNKILEDVQKYYTRLVIDKNINKFSNFSNLIKMHRFPKNVLNYAKKYFNERKRAKINGKLTEKFGAQTNNVKSHASGYYYIPPILDKSNDSASFDNFEKSLNYAGSDNKKIEPITGDSMMLIEPLNSTDYDSYLTTTASNLNATDEFQAKLDRFNASLKSFKDRSEAAEREFSVKPLENKNKDDGSIVRTNQVLTEIKKAVDKRDLTNLNGRIDTTVKKTVDDISSFKVEGYDINSLKKDLESAMEQVKFLNDGIKNFLNNVDARYDIKLQAALKENQRLTAQLENANALANSLKEHLLKKLDDSYKKNIALSQKNIGLADTMIELSDILREYQNQNSELTELLRKAVNEIERLRNDNKTLLMKMNIEFEDLKKENKILKERLDLQTQSITAPKTDFNLELKNRAQQTLK